ncbi:MAG TPA: DUF4126 domain-containing protein [Anaerolineales bacterium]
MQALLAIFSAFGLSASAGLNAYIPLLVVGVVAHYTDLIKLSPPFDTLANPWILIMLGVLLIIEMLADKVPAVNHINDGIQTFVRPVAGAIAFAAGTNVIQGINPVVALACGLLVSGGVHLAKSAAVRPLVTAATGGAANTPVSVAEDVTSTAVSVAAVLMPVLVAVLAGMLILALLWWWARPEPTPKSA